MRKEADVAAAVGCVETTRKLYSATQRYGEQIGQKKCPQKHDSIAASCAPAKIRWETAAVT